MVVITSFVHEVDLDAEVSRFHKPHTKTSGESCPQCPTTPYNPKVTQSLKKRKRISRSENDKKIGLCKSLTEMTTLVGFQRKDKARLEHATRAICAVVARLVKRECRTILPHVGKSSPHAAG